jgi:hypothetical protein
MQYKLESISQKLFLIKHIYDFYIVLSKAKGTKRCQAYKNAWGARHTPRRLAEWTKAICYKLKKKRNIILYYFI